MCLLWRTIHKDQLDHMLLELAGVQCAPSPTVRLEKRLKRLPLKATPSLPTRTAVVLTRFIRLSIPEKEVLTAWSTQCQWDIVHVNTEGTSKLRFSSVIFLEYSRSATRTLFSICSVFAWTSFRIVINLSTAASKVRRNGLGSNAGLNNCLQYVVIFRQATYVHYQPSNEQSISQKRIQWRREYRICPTKQELSHTSVIHFCNNLERR